MVKPFKTLNQQIEYLEKNKNIIFECKDDAKIYLLNNNYYNVISTSKVFQCIDIASDGSHIYKAENFGVWQNLFEEDLKASEYLLRNVLIIERKINSRLAYYLSEIVHMGILNDQERKKLANFINDTLKNRDKENAYKFNQTWVFVSSFTFKSTMRMIDQIARWIKYRKKISGSRKEIQYLEFCYDSILQGYKTVRSKDELVNLRNSLAHYVPLTVYVTGKGVMKDRIQVINIVANEINNQSIEKFIKIMQDKAINYKKMKKANSL